LLAGTVIKEDDPENGKFPVNFADKAYWSMIFSENRYPLFGIMLKSSAEGDG
jgi:hypothetical protein